MNDPALRPAEIAAAALVLGGGLLLVWPQHGASLLRLVIVTVAAAAGLYVLAAHAPPAWWISPFDRTGRARRKGRGSEEIEWIGAMLAGRRQRIEHGPPLPPGTLRLLQPLIAAALERQGIATHASLPPLTRAVLTAEPLKHAPWFRTVAPDPARVAEAVHRVMDELESMVAGAREGDSDDVHPNRRET